jgi:parallel beta-helix repeat protein
MSCPPSLRRALLLSVALVVMLGFAAAQPRAAEAVIVNCSAGQTIRQALTLSGGGGSAPKQLVITLSGNCNENVVIARDDVTINTNGVATATITAQDPNQPAILLDGARRIVIDGVVANGISLVGGTYGLAAVRGSTAILANCDVSGATNTGVNSSYSSTLEVDRCVLRNSNRGGVAANDAQLIVTNSTVRNNTNEGLVAVRSAYLRTGQDRSGNPVARPVTVNNNGTQGISIVDSSSTTILATTVRDNLSDGILLIRGSAGTIGTGVNGLVAPNTITNNGLGTLASGISVIRTSAALIQGNAINSNARGVFVGQSAAATVIGNSVQNNVGRGVQVSESGSARIGVIDGATATSANTISGNTTDGIGVFEKGQAVVGGNTITSNGGHGINMNMGTMSLVGGNTISSNAFHGINVGASRLFQAPGTFGTLPDTADVSQNNGLAGLFLFNNSSADLYRITLTGNARQGIGASLNSTINLHVYDAARPNNFISITGNGTANIASNNDGITLFSASMLTSPQNPGGPGQLVISGQPGWGVNCFGTTNKAAAALDTTGISGNALGTVNCGGF